jgi:hypothetical protein
VGQGAIVCLLAAAAGALGGDILGALAGVAAVAIPAATGAAALRRIGRREASLIAAIALAAPCVRLVVSVVLAAALWLGAEGAGSTFGVASFWGAFVLAALGTLTVDTLGFAADFRALTGADTETAPA